LFAGYFSELILHDRQYKYVFHVFGGTLTLYALNALLISVINGFKEYKLYVVANILGSVIGLLFSVVLALTYGIPGALISAVTFQSVVFFLTIWMVRRSKWFNWKSFFTSFSKLAMKRLSGYSLMALASAITIPAGQLLVRNFIIENQSIDEAGLWEGINRISNMYLTIITVSLAVYYLPRMSELKERNAIRQEVFSVYKLMLPFLLITTILIFLFRGLIIRILFTEEFAEMEKLFAWQLVGDFLKIAGWVLGYLLIAKAMAKTYVILELFNFIFLVLISYFLVPYAGSIGATQAYAILYAVYLVILLFIFRHLLFGSDKTNNNNPHWA
jgi:PST family polysaccharide transporter